MARKHYYAPLAHQIGEYLRSKGFKTDETGLIHKRGTLEVRQTEKHVTLLNYAKKQYVTITGIFHHDVLAEFVRTGILPYPHSVKTFSE